MLLPCPFFLFLVPPTFGASERKAKDLLAQAVAHRELSSSRTFDDLGSEIAFR